MREIKVRLKTRSYSIKIGEALLAKAGTYISQLPIGRYGIVITNPKIQSLYRNILKKSLSKSGIDAQFLTVPDSETSKSFRVLSQVLNKIAELDRGKKPFIVAFGGGVIGDLAGFIAAVYRRGVPLIQIPTTLVAQVDSAIGGKTAIDLPVAKNLVGAFYQPNLVISDISLLETLPEREIRCGLAEIIKYSVISSRKFFDFISENIVPLKKLKIKTLEYVIGECGKIKSKIVSADEIDTKNIRVVLNYGHTIGHAIEAASGYRGIYNHGEAVALGMIAAAGISDKLGMLSTEEAGKIRNLIGRAGLPVNLKNIECSAILKALGHDKKFAHGINRFVLPLKIGRVKIIDDIAQGSIVDAIKEIAG